MADLPPRESYSAMATYLKCGLQYYLRYLADIPEEPGWYQVGGTAVHAETERLDRERFKETGT